MYTLAFYIRKVVSFEKCCILYIIYFGHIFCHLTPLRSFSSSDLPNFMLFLSLSLKRKKNTENNQIQKPKIKATENQKKKIQQTIKRKTTIKNTKQNKKCTNKTWSPYCVGQIFLYMRPFLECGCYNLCCSIGTKLICPFLAGINW